MEESARVQKFICRMGTSYTLHSEGVLEGKTENIDSLGTNI
jgi:hypothetical protein